MKLNEQKLVLSMYERSAFLEMRKLIKKKPEVLPALLSGLSREAAAQLLLTAKTEIESLLQVNRAFVAAASALAKKENTGEQHEGGGAC